jgi:hypothetical protein
MKTRKLPGQQQVYARVARMLIFIGALIYLFLIAK